MTDTTGILSIKSYRSLMKRTVLSIILWGSMGLSKNVTPKSMNYYLNNSSKAKALHNAPDSTGPVFKDQTIIPVVADLCQTLYRKTSVKELEQIQQAEILRQLRFRFSSNVNQMARVTGLPYETVVKLLESF